MIRADKRGPLAWWWARYIDGRLRRAFRGIWVRGALPGPDARVLAYANHTNFWDGFLAHAISRAAGWDGHCAMEEQNLARYRFLRRLGAFSVRRGDPRATVETLRYARGLLRSPGTAVFLFPEGVLRSGARTLAPLERGLEVLARASKATCLPFAIRYAFFEHELPDVLLDVGQAHAPEPIEHSSERLAALVAGVHAAPSLDGFVPLVRGGASIAERWDALRT